MRRAGLVGLAGLVAGLAGQGCSQLEGRTLLLLELTLDVSVAAPVAKLEISIASGDIEDWSSLKPTQTVELSPAVSPGSPVPIKRGVYLSRGTGGAHSVRVVARSVSGAQVGMATAPVTLKEGASTVHPLRITGTSVGTGCDPVLQTGCSGTDKCVYDCAAGEGVCIELGAGLPGDPCTSPSGCGPGMTCEAGTCRRYCRGDSDCPAIVTSETCSGQQLCASTPGTAPRLCGTVIAGGCNPYRQDCGLAQRCDFHCDGGDEYRCESVLALSTVLEGQPCSSQSACAKGHACVPFSSGDKATFCRKYCTSQSDCAPNQVCTDWVAPSCNGNAPGARVCAPCDPLAPADCPDGQKCVFDCAIESTRCVSFGPRLTGEACAVASDCAEGLDCVGGFCQRYCNTDADCPSGDTAQYCAFWASCKNATTQADRYSFCLNACEPADTDGTTAKACGLGQRCDIHCDGGQPYRCTSGNLTGRVLGETCYFQTECAPGYACIYESNDTTTGTCRQYCTSAASCPMSMPYCRPASGPICTLGETSASMICTAK